MDANAPSAAPVVYDYYGGKERFPNIDEALMAAVDKADSAQFNMEEVANPTGWPLFSFMMDPRTCQVEHDRSASVQLDLIGRNIAAG